MQSPLHRRAAALILVLWSIALLSLLAGGLSFAIRQDLAISNIERDRLVAHWLARAGVERAIAAIKDDYKLTDTLDDLWCDNPTEMQEIQLTGGTFSVMHDDYEAIPQVLYGASDESAKLNVNVATREQLMELLEMTEPIAAAIIDWRDQNEDPLPEGTERGYYTNLAHPYDIRNAQFRTVRELLLVRGVTPELFYDEDTNVNGLLEPNENDGKANMPPDNQDGRLDRGWFAYLTVYSYEKNVNGSARKRININEDDANTLAQRLNLEEWAAKSIAKARENKKFEHLVDLLEVKRDSSTSSGDSDSDINARSEEEKNQPVTKTIFKRIVDDITLTSDDLLPGKININTAPLTVLRTLPGVDDSLADTILQGRRQYAGGYASIGYLLDLNGMTTKKFGKIEDKITVRSNVFRIYSQGQSSSGLAKATIDCVVDRTEEVPKILYWLESAP